MFLLKKILASALMPLSIVCLLLFLSLILLLFTHRQGLGKFTLAVALALLIAFSLPPLPREVTRPLEHHAPVVVDDNLKGVEWIIILGGGKSDDPRLPATEQLHDASLARLVEGIRLHRQLPGSRLMVSGAPLGGDHSNAKVYAEAAKLLGVPSEAIQLNGHSRDTFEEATDIARRIGKVRALLVTSANHMPRALMLFREQGVDAIPAPTDYLTKDGPQMAYYDYLPRGGNLVVLERGWHENMGALWHRITGMFEQNYEQIRTTVEEAL